MTTVLQPTYLTDSPSIAVCPNCGNDIVTNTNRKNGLLSYLTCLALCLLGCDCGCCLIPFCIPACKDVDHTCPYCRYKIGKYTAI